MKTTSRNNDGAALILALIFLTSMAILIGGLASRTHSQINHSMAYVDYDHSLQGIEAGFAMARAEINGDFGAAAEENDGFIGLDTGYDLSASQPWFGHAMVTPLSLASMPDIEFFVFSYDWGTDNIDNNGDLGNLVDLLPNPPLISSKEAALCVTARSSH